MIRLIENLLCRLGFHKWVSELVPWAATKRLVFGIRHCERCNKRMMRRSYFGHLRWDDK